MTVCIYTANAGGYDIVRPQVEQDIAVEWWCFVDDDQRIPAPWHVGRGTPRHENSNLAAKWWKTHPPLGVEHAIWIDANMQVTSPAFAREAIASLDVPTPGVVNPNMAGGFEPLRPVTQRASFAVWRHPRRDNVHAEVQATMSSELQPGKYDLDLVRAQMAHYDAEGYPNRDTAGPGTGLYACGTIVWTPAARRLGEAWWDECVRWTPQDQVSLPYVCWKRNEYPAVFRWPQLPRPFDRKRGYFQNRWLRIFPHGRE